MARSQRVNETRCSPSVLFDRAERVSTTEERDDRQTGTLVGRFDSHGPVDILEAIFYKRISRIARYLAYDT